MTSRFNGYFNAKEIMLEQETTLKGSYKDDYTQLLLIFIFPDETKSQGLYDPMDKIIEKCSEVIERHSIDKRNVEYVKWIDDSYFLIGKARFYKHEFGLAEQTFLYVYQHYKKSPNRYQGLNWLIKTLIETEQWDRAEEFLDLAESSLKKYPEELLGEYHAIVADFNIRRDKDYEKAIEHLEKVVELTKKRDGKVRYQFILAQLYQEKNNFLLATEAYTDVLKLNPDYTMRFNARISRAIAFDVNGRDSKAIKKELNKMLKDIKNEEFKDQIYFALAELALKEDDEPMAVILLQRSINSSVANDKQKALSYLRLADLYFERPDYIAAQERYDSTLQFLTEEHPDYYPTEDKNNSLQDLVKNLKVIKLQDSLLALSNLGSGAREKKVKEIIKALKAEDERKKQAELNKLQAAQNNQQNPGLINVVAGGRKGKWYFYNPTTIALGINDFKTEWGDIQLSDNWRRKNKVTAAVVPKLDPQEQEAAKVDSLELAERYNPNFYLEAIPKDYQEQLLAHAKVSEALFNVGTIFKESFRDYVSAINSFERITVQYDTSKFNLPAHYQLYRIYKLNEYDEKAEIEKNWVLDSHPFSEYAYLIKNPNYSKESKATKEKVEEFYVSAYKLYRYGLYADVISSCEKANRSFSENHLKAKFDLLKAQSIGQLRSKSEFKTALEKVIKDHPNTPEQARAQEMLNFLLKQMAGKSVAQNTHKVNYEKDDKDQHMVIVSAKTGKNRGFNVLKNKLADFNKSSFRELKLTVTESALGEKTMYLIRGFANEADATRHLKALKNHAPVSTVVNQFNGEEYLISNANFRKLFKSKDEAQYLEFFQKDYPL